MDVLAQINKLSISFGDKDIFQDASLTVNRGDKTGLIGLNGKGKSTLLKVLNRDMGADEESGFSYDQKKDLSILYIPQEVSEEMSPYRNPEKFYLNFYPQLAKVHQQLTEVEEQMSTDYQDKLVERQGELLEMFEDLGGWRIEQGFLNYLKKFAFNEFDQDFFLLSGGEKRKIVISVGLSCEHDLILWDEPTNHLDLKTVELFETELLQSNSTFILISHDRYILSEVCEKIIHIENSKIRKFDGSYIEYLDYLSQKEAERVKTLDKLKNTYKRELEWMRQGIKARGTRSKKRVEGFNQISENIQGLKAAKKKKVELSLSHSQKKSKKILTIKNLGFSYESEYLFEDVNLKLFKKDRVALIGSNGSGKSTLLKLIQGDLAVQDGVIEGADDLVINYFSQNREALDPNKTAIDVVGEGSDMIHLPGDQVMHVNAYLERFLFSSQDIRMPISYLSGGEKNRLQLAMFMKKAADLWIFDEPTNDLDIETIEVLEAALMNYKQTIILVSHDRAFLDKLVNKCWIIRDGTVTELLGNYNDNSDLILQDDSPKKKTILKEVSSTPSDTSDKITNKEKQRLKSIEPDIANLETKIDKIKAQMASFDFSTGDPKDLEKFKALETSLKKFELQLEQLFTEWEKLNTKMENQ